MNKIKCCNCNKELLEHHFGRGLIYKTRISCDYYCYDCIDSGAIILGCSLCKTRKNLGQFVTDSNLQKIPLEKLKSNGVEECCSDCYQLSHILCQECGKYHFVDFDKIPDTRYNGINIENIKLRENKFSYFEGALLCNPCFNESVSERMLYPRSAIRQETFNIHQPVKNFKVNRFTGIESEIITDFEDTDDIQYIDTPRNWKAVYDGSLNLGGVEFKTISPRFGDNIITDLRRLQNLNENMGYRADKSCGVHVHFEARDFKLTEIKNLLLLMNKIEPIIFESLPSDRQDNRFCQRLELDTSDLSRIETLKDLTDLWYNRMSETEFSTTRYSEARYRGVNIHSRFMLGTIEFRYHEGTHRAKPIYDWIRFCNSIMTASWNLSNGFTPKWKNLKKELTNNKLEPEEIILLMGGKSALNYIEKRKGE